MTSTSSPSTPGEPRVCAQCGKVESERLWLYPGRMFKIWKGASSPVDLCSFECSAKWHAPGEGTAWTDADRDRVWPEGWLKCPLHPDQHGDVYHSANWHEDRPPASGEGTRQRPGDSCSYCNSAGDIDCPTEAILDALTAATAPGDNP